MNSIQDELKHDCPVCNGSGNRLFENKFIPCKACEGTGLSQEWRELEQGLKDVFTCPHCGAHKVHYRLYGYRCPHHCEDNHG